MHSQIVPNDEVERRASPQTEADLSRSFDPPGPQRSRDPLLQPIVRLLLRTVRIRGLSLRHNFTIHIMQRKIGFRR